MATLIRNNALNWGIEVPGYRKEIGLSFLLSLKYLRQERFNILRVRLDYFISMASHVKCIYTIDQ